MPSGDFWTVVGVVATVVGVVALPVGWWLTKRHERAADLKSAARGLLSDAEDLTNAVAAAVRANQAAPIERVQPLASWSAETRARVDRVASFEEAEMLDGGVKLIRGHMQAAVDALPGDGTLGLAAAGEALSACDACAWARKLWLVLSVDASFDAIKKGEQVVERQDANSVEFVLHPDLRSPASPSP